MFSIGRPLTRGASVLCCALLATTVDAGDVKPAARGTREVRPGVQQMVIYNGATRTVRYIGQDLSPSEATMLRELERLENESAYVGDLQSLKRQYVADERLLEANRTAVQLNLYGREVTRSATDTVYANSGYGYPYGYGYGYPYAYGFAGYFGMPYGYGGGAAPTASASDSVTVKESVANGVGPVGPTPTAMAAVLAQQATPEYAATVDRAYDRVAMRANQLPRLGLALRQPAAGSSQFRFVEYELMRYTITLKDGETIHCKRYSVDKDDKDMYVIESAGDSKTWIPKSEVKRIYDAGTSIKPAIR
jgi:hypothetical protein